MNHLEQCFDIAFSAPAGVEKLRELVLDLAIKGKLVPQDPHDISLDQLLRTIHEDRENLLAERKVKYRDISEQPAIESMRFGVPESWRWVRFREVVFFQEGPGIRKWQFTDEGIKLLNVSNILFNSDLDFTNSDKFVSLDEFSQKYTHFEVLDGDLLFASSGGSWGKIAWYKDPGFRVMLNTSTIRLRFFSESFDPNYLYYFLKSECFRKQLAIQLTGMQPNFGSTHLSRIYIPIPPASEQRRIVAKIDQLMARCDELEKLREARDRLQIKVHMAACDRLLTAPDTDTSTQSWQFITQHFSELYTVKENVAELRKVILQLAVMGKLVPQDSTELPANKLLEKIRTEKQTLVKRKVIKKPKSFPQISPEESPFNLPQKWEWVRLVDLAKQIDYGTSQKSGTDSSQVPVYRMGNIVDGHLVNGKFKYVSPNIKDLPRLYLQENDILFNRTNSYELVGKTAIYFGENNSTTFASYLIRITLFDEYLFAAYFSLAMNAPYFRKTQIEPEIVQQCGQANFNGTKLSATIIPLPPLEEQHRIVTKVNQLMSLCDTLEQQIDATTQKQTALLNAITAKL